MRPGSIHAISLALSIAACGGKIMVPGQASPDASDFDRSASNVGTPAYDASAMSQSEGVADASDSGDGGAPDVGPVACIAAGGVCFPGDRPCGDQVSTLSCGESTTLDLYCCISLNPVPPPMGGEAFSAEVSDAGEADADSIGEFGYFCPEGTLGGPTTCPPLPVAIFNGVNAAPVPLSVGCSYSYCYLSGACVDCPCVAVDGGTAWDCDASATDDASEAGGD